MIISIITLIAKNVDKEWVNWRVLIVFTIMFDVVSLFLTFDAIKYGCLGDDTISKYIIDRFIPWDQFSQDQLNKMYLIWLLCALVYIYDDDRYWLNFRVGFNNKNGITGLMLSLPISPLYSKRSKSL